MMKQKLKAEFSEGISPDDIFRVRKINLNSELYSDEEVDVAVGIAKEAVLKGEHGSGHSYLW